MMLVSSFFLVPSLEIRPPSVYEMERGTPTRRVQASNDSPYSPLFVLPRLCFSCWIAITVLVPRVDTDAHGFWSGHYCFEV